ncbi:MAG: hypothetical protein JXA11_14135 [Phycisphaerae bacterium]|nr:hypothetical protein [Phycisphaerae bacterium]
MDGRKGLAMYLSHKKWKHAARWKKRIKMAIRRGVKPILGQCTMGLDVPYRKCCGRGGAKDCRYLSGEE